MSQLTKNPQHLPYSGDIILAPQRRVFCCWQWWVINALKCHVRWWLVVGEWHFDWMCYLCGSLLCCAGNASSVQVRVGVCGTRRCCNFMLHLNFDNVTKPTSLDKNLPNDRLLLTRHRIVGGKKISRWGREDENIIVECGYVSAQWPSTEYRACHAFSLQ